MAKSKKLPELEIVPMGRNLKDPQTVNGYTPAEAAKVLGTSLSYMYVLISTRRIGFIKLGNRTFITEAAIAEYRSYRRHKNKNALNDIRHDIKMHALQLRGVEDLAAYTVPEAAAILKVHVNTIRNLIKSGKLHAWRFNYRYLIPASSLQDLMTGKYVINGKV